MRFLWLINQKEDGDLEVNPVQLLTGLKETPGNEQYNMYPVPHYYFFLITSYSNSCVRKDVSPPSPDCKLLISMVTVSTLMSDRHVFPSLLVVSCFHMINSTKLAGCTATFSQLH